ncbi:MAG TPA: hypothetical protein VGC42_06855, partial [Kofleriaceae bacterium]
FAIDEGDPDYSIEILPGDTVGSGATPRFADAGEEGWPISDESGAHDRPTREGLELELLAAAQAGVDPAPPEESDGISFDSATREYPGGAGRPATSLLHEGLPAPDAGDFESAYETPPFGTARDLQTPQDFGSQLTDVRRRDLGFVKPSQPGITPPPAEPAELKMTLRTPPGPTQVGGPVPLTDSKVPASRSSDPHRATTSNGDDGPESAMVATGAAPTIEMSDPLGDGSAYDSLDLELSVSSDPAIALDLVGRAQTHQARPGDTASRMLGEASVDRLFDNDDDDFNPPAPDLSESFADVLDDEPAPTPAPSPGRSPSMIDPVATAAKAAQIIAAARAARLSGAHDAADDAADDEPEHDPLDLLKTLPVPSKPRTPTTPTSPTRDLEDRPTREMPPEPRPTSMIPQMTRDFADLQRPAELPAVGRTPSRPPLTTNPPIASGPLPVASKSSGMIPALIATPSGQFRAVQPGDSAMIAAPTRDLGLRGRPPTEDEPTTELDAAKIRAAAPPRRDARPTLPGLDPIDAQSAEILEEIDRGAPTSETREDRTRRRISTLIERSAEWSRAGDVERAVTAVDLALSEDPNSALAQKLIHRNRDTILGAFQSFLGDLQRIPALARPLHELGSAPISPRAAFLLSRVDGTLSLDEILDVSGMPRLEAYRYLCQLFLRGILR